MISMKKRLCFVFALVLVLESAILDCHASSSLDTYTHIYAYPIKSVSMTDLSGALSVGGEVLDDLLYPSGMVLPTKYWDFFMMGSLADYSYTMCDNVYRFMRANWPTEDGYYTYAEYEAADLFYAIYAWSSSLSAWDTGAISKSFQDLFVTWGTSDFINVPDAILYPTEEFVRLYLEYSDTFNTYGNLEDERDVTYSSDYINVCQSGFEDGKYYALTFGYAGNIAYRLKNISLGRDDTTGIVGESDAFLNRIAYSLDIGLTLIPSENNYFTQDSIKEYCGFVDLLAGQGNYLNEFVEEDCYGVANSDGLIMPSTVSGVHSLNQYWRLWALDSPSEEDVVASGLLNSERLIGKVFDYYTYDWEQYYIAMGYEGQDLANALASVNSTIAGDLEPLQSSSVSESPSVDEGVSDFGDVEESASLEDVNGSSTLVGSESPIDYDVKGSSTGTSYQSISKVDKPLSAFDSGYTSEDVTDKTYGVSDIVTIACVVIVIGLLSGICISDWWKKRQDNIFPWKRR